MGRTWRRAPKGRARVEGVAAALDLGQSGTRPAMGRMWQHALEGGAAAEGTEQSGGGRCDIGLIYGLVKQDDPEVGRLGGDQGRRWR
ncbi:hypothetical protein GUJ93_ZPchr0002g23858 [Zizania palustris]|uniref:Uncharacterized protein n=1 Tax=Zizania palustris TaxID=103762 RepID=A0A8J5VH45_ZIZPA|nr:hypothetical protein GUJ93_ZPchr0002g23858 [Zizania palustris]